ncbi:MAG: efflux RND transporter permease subunit [Calditrichota bacterium]
MGQRRRFQDVEQAGAERSQAWLLAVACVLLLMGALFESFVLPWSVIVTVPISFFGVWWLLWATGTQFGVMAAVGVVILIGVVVNNAIVLIDRANQLRASGMARDEALLEAARQRFRPIMMTALTTVMGLLPMAVGAASMVGIPYAPMGRAIIGGLLAGTIATPVAIPLAYSLIEEGKDWIRAYAASFSRDKVRK